MGNQSKQKDGVKNHFLLLPQKTQKAKKTFTTYSLLLQGLLRKASSQRQRCWGVLGGQSLSRHFLGCKASNTQSHWVPCWLTFFFFLAFVIVFWYSQNPQDFQPDTGICSPTRTPVAESAWARRKPYMPVSSSRLILSLWQDPQGQNHFRGLGSENWSTSLHLI